MKDTSRTAPLADFPVTFAWTCARSAKRVLRSASAIPVAAVLGLMLALGLQGCVSSTSEVLDASKLKVFEARTFAWVEEPVSAPEVEGALKEQVEDTAMIADARKALTAQLVERGYRITSQDGAGVHLALRLDVSEQQLQNDPFFTVDQFVRFEEGHLTMMAFVPVTYVPVWEATAAVRLRDVARGMGPGEIKWEALDETRDWQVDKLAKTIAERLP